MGFYITIGRFPWFCLLVVRLHSSSRGVVPRDRCVDIFLGLTDCWNRGALKRVNLLFRRRVVFCWQGFRIFCGCFLMRRFWGCIGFVYHRRGIDSVWYRRWLHWWLTDFLFFWRDIVFWFRSRRFVLHEEFWVRVLRRLKFYGRCRGNQRWRCGVYSRTGRGRLLRWCWSIGTWDIDIYIF